MTDLMVDVPGGKVFTRSWKGAPGDAAPIILMHDSLGSVELWRDFPAALAQASARTVIAYDRLGFGKSEPLTERPPVNFISAEADRVFPVLRQALAIERFVLFGHSVGGAMALATAALHGEGCEAVITESAQSFVEPLTLSGIRAAKQQFSNDGELARLERWHGERAPWVLDAWTGVWLSPEFASWSLDELLPRVQTRVLAIHGDRDDYGTTEFPRHIARRVSGPAEIAILEDCGHVPHREKSAEVLRRVSAFLATTGTIGSIGGRNGPVVQPISDAAAVRTEGLGRSQN
ncbi:MAG: alpha/beta hydrolase [Proteobacteria bacterium]|nr:alpha/beta hydrolase [Pseudomonadota bacterium]